MSQLAQNIGTTLKSGDTIGRGRYIVQRFLGAGTMARVYHAIDTQISSATGAQDRALKILDPQETATRHGISKQEAINDFDREARILLHGTYRNVVRAYDYFVEHGLHVLVLEYVDGATLEEVKKSRKVSEDEVIMWANETFDMLEDLHAKNLVYRDLKLGNMMVRADNHLTFIDFGTARDIGIPLAQGVQANGTAVGTPGYAAPEQWSGKLDFRSDLYALGVIMKELLSGNDPVVFDTQPLTGYPLELCSFVNKATKLDANERYQTVDEMRCGLQGAGSIASRVAARTIVTQSQYHKPSLEEMWNEADRVRISLKEGDWANKIKSVWTRAVGLEKIGSTYQAQMLIIKYFRFNKPNNTAGSFFIRGIWYEWLGRNSKALNYYFQAIRCDTNAAEAYNGIARVEAKIEQEKQDKRAKKLAKKTARSVKIKQIGGTSLQGIFWLGRQLDPRNCSALINGDRAWVPHIAVLVGTILGFALNRRSVGYDLVVCVGIILSTALLLGCLFMFQSGIASFGNGLYFAFGDGCTCMIFSITLLVISVFLFSINTEAAYYSAQWGPRASVLVAHEESFRAMRVDIKEDGISEKEWIYVKEDGELWTGESPDGSEGAVMVSARTAAEARGKVAKISGKDTILRVFFERHRKDIYGKNHKIWRVVTKTI